MRDTIRIALGCRLACEVRKRMELQRSNALFAIVANRVGEPYSLAHFEERFTDVRERMQGSSLFAVPSEFSFADVDARRKKSSTLVFPVGENSFEGIEQLGGVFIFVLFFVPMVHVT